MPGGDAPCGGSGNGVPARAGAPFGPWREDVSPTERAFLLGLLAGLGHSLLGKHHPWPDVLRRAAFGGAAELGRAWSELGALEPLGRRRVLTSYAERTKPPIAAPGGATGGRGERMR